MDDENLPCDDSLTLEHFRRRMAGIEPHVPDPPLPRPERRDGAVRLRQQRPARRDTRPLHVYALLALTLVALVAVALPYLGGERSMPRVVPSGPGTTPPAATVPATLPAATVSPAADTTPAIDSTAPASSQADLAPAPRLGACRLAPILYEAPWFTNEAWAGADWAVIEGRLQADGGRRLLIHGTRGPFAGPTRPVLWPAGYVEQPADGGLTLFDAEGRPVAREGDLVVIGGHLTGGSDTWSACGIRLVRGARTR